MASIPTFRWKVSRLLVLHCCNRWPTFSYDANAITFIASKTDDISCSEVIRALQLEDDPELEEIEERIEQYKDETKEWKQKKTVAEKSAKGVTSQPWAYGILKRANIAFR